MRRPNVLFSRQRDYMHSVEKDNFISEVSTEENCP